MWWHCKGSTFLETSFLHLPSVINVISFFLTLFVTLLKLLKRLQIYITLLLRLIFFAQPFSFSFFFFLNQFSFLMSVPSNPKEATQWKHILHLAQKFIFCSEWRHFNRNANIGRILERNRIMVTVFRPLKQLI